MSVLSQSIRLDLLKLRSGTVFHANATTAISAPAATDAASLVTLANAIKDCYRTHVASACSAEDGTGAHLEADAVNTVPATDCTDYAGAIRVLNSVKRCYENHRLNGRYHCVIDTANMVTSFDAFDDRSGAVQANPAPTPDVLASAFRLSADLKTTLNAHFASAFSFTLVDE